MIKKISFVLLCAVFISIFALSSVAFAEEAYYFERFDVEIKINSDYTFEVTENLTVEFNDERHGIYRNLPNYWGEDRIKYKNIKVEGAPVKVLKEEYQTSLRIGDADVYINGTQHYKISYTIHLPKDSNPTMDSIYMNVIGFDHSVYTMNSSIKITMPIRTVPDYLNVFSGYYYDEAASNKVEFIYSSRKTLYIDTVKPLEPYEGITIKIDLEEGYFKDVKNPFFIDDFMRSYLPMLFVLTGLILWVIFGRDKKIIPPVEINPPDLSPVEAGFIIDGEVDGDDVAAMLIYWASIGFLKIEESKKKNSYRFYKLKDIEDRPKYEKTLFNALFKETDTTEYITSSTVKSRMASKGHSFKTKVSNKYKKGAKKLITAKSLSFSNFVMFLAYLCFGLIGFFIALREGVITAMFLTAFTLIPFTFLQIWLKNILTYRRKRRGGKTAIRVIIYSLVVFIVWLIVIGIASETSLSFEHASIMFLGSIFLIIVSYFTQQMSEYGHEKYERVLGFRHFMLTAEKDWLERLAKDDPEFFYDRLPYALVLGVSKVWIGKFANAVTSPPSWYSGSASGFNARTFSSTMVSDFSRMGAYAVPKSTTSSGSYRSGSSSSFSSGGGFSGGGFSGGGSSSW